MNPQTRTGLTHAGTAVGGALAAIAFMSSHSVDIYAVWDQLNVVVASVTKFVALITPLLTAAYGVYKASTGQKLADVMADPKSPQIAADMPVTVETIAVANALKQG